MSVEFKEETPRGILDADEEARWREWNSIHKQEAVRHLREELRSAPPELLETWRRQYREGKRIGSNDPNFHFGNGMMIRNYLRHQCPDDRLPLVDYGNGNSYQNWDDWYLPALREALGLEVES